MNLGPGKGWNVIISRFNKLFCGDRILIPILLLAFFVRIIGLGDAPFSFEVVWKPPVEEMLKGSFYYTKDIPHPPMIVVLHYLFALAAGLSIQVFRSMSLLMGMSTIVVSYFFAKSLYNRKAAILSALLMAVVFYPVWMSLFVDIDGSVLTFFMLASLFSFHKLEKTKERKWLLMTGVFIGLALLSKYSAVLLFPVLIIYDLFANKLKNLKTIITVLLIGGAVFSLFPLSSLLLNRPEMITDTLRWGTEGAVRADSTNILYAYVLSFARMFIFLFQYGTPILCIIPLYLLLRKGEKKEYILLSYAGLILVFFTLVTTGGPKARYITPAVPALTILASNAILTVFNKFDRKDAYKMISVSAVFYAVLVCLNTYGVQEAFNSQNIKPSLLLQNSIFWYSGFESTPFAIHVHSLIFVMLVSVILFLLSLKLGKKFVIALVSLGLAFNFFILAQSFYPTAGPNFTATVFEMVGYYKANNLNCSALYSNEWSFMFYLDDVKLLYADSIAQKDLMGCVFTINVQDMSESKELQDAVKGCEEAKTFYSNGFEFGHIYICE
jgi:4-amino-4-deoxy-L-arabinose transferase-like glycosyltransferase